jgi:hypothetical protein
LELVAQEAQLVATQVQTAATACFLALHQPVAVAVLVETTTMDQLAVQAVEHPD